MLKYGKKIDWLERLADEGHEIPAVEERPQLYEDLILDWQAFLTISASRPQGLSGIAPLPLTEILAYAKIYDITDGEELQHFVTRIRLMDRLYIEAANDKD